MKEAGRHECWTTVRQTLCGLQRTTTSFRRREGGVLHVRKTARADAEQDGVYRAMGIGAPPRNLRKTLH